MPIISCSYYYQAWRDMWSLWTFKVRNMLGWERVEFKTLIKLFGDKHLWSSQRVARRGLHAIKLISAWSCYHRLVHLILISSLSLHSSLTPRVINSPMSSLLEIIICFGFRFGTSARSEMERIGSAWHMAKLLALLQCWWCYWSEKVNINTLLTLMFRLSAFQLEFIEMERTGRWWIEDRGRSTEEIICCVWLLFAANRQIWFSTHSLLS